MSDAVRRARLRGAREAERILGILEVRQRLVATNERVDVFGALAWLDVRVMFRPLHGLLGAYIRGDRPGVMINTQRPSSVQRFTAAHELGHAVLGHEPSLDSPGVMQSAAADQPRPKISGFASYLQEIEADAFAGGFLLPVWLITRHAHRHGWTRASLVDENIVYQLALRCGASFQATVWALDRHRFITTPDRLRMLAVKPKTIKARLGHNATVASGRADAWLLTPCDVGTDICIAVGDTVNVDVGDGSWQSDCFPKKPLVSLENSAMQFREGIFSFHASTSGIANLRFTSRQRIQDDEIIIRLNITVTEPESGLSRANRARLIRNASNGHGRHAG